MSSGPDVTLFNAPSDGISSVVFAPRDNLLLASSWDKTVRMYDADTNVMRAQYHLVGPALDCSFEHSQERIFSGGLDRRVIMHDLATGSEFVLGSHDDAVRCVEHSETLNTVLTGGWDKKLMSWDRRAPTALATTAALPDKAFSMGMDKSRVVVATAGRRLVIFDLRNLSAPVEDRESPLKFQTRCVRCFPEQSGFVLASVEGRCAVEFYSETGRFAFKCHRTREQDMDVVYPVNALAFHPRYGTFATGGSDGIVNVWDRVHKKRLSQFRKYNTGISSLSFNSDGSLLAIAVSYTFDEGDKDHPEDSIVIRRVQDSEVKPR